MSNVMDTGEIFERIINIIERGDTTPFEDPDDEDAFECFKECHRDIEKALGEDFFNQ